MTKQPEREFDGKERQMKLWYFPEFIMVQDTEDIISIDDL